jgi:hypothetical protein
MSIWAVRIVGRITPVNVEAAGFVAAVAKAVEYARTHGIPETDIISVDYLAY